ncbi:MAG: hypothetical protein JXA25_09935 [Anaerolineales bacterium]|nr:hypothetical protein [Anaerolineales bacterium]
MKVNRNPKIMLRRIRTWMLVSLLGLIFFLIGINPGLFELNRSQVIGFLQIGLWCTGLSLFMLGAYSMIRIYRNGLSNTLLSDVGVRLASTGLVLAIAASYADFLGIGSHSRSVLLFGPLQVIGLTVGIIISLIGLVLYWPWKRKTPGRTEPEKKILPDSEKEE